MIAKLHIVTPLVHLLVLLLLPEFSSASSSLESMVASLSVAGYTQFAAAIQAHIPEPATIDRNLTYFAPSDDSLNGLQITQDFVHYHVVSGSSAFTYRDLVGLVPGIQLRTLFGSATLLVTESMGDQHRFSVNNILVDVPNIYFDGNSSVHGLAAPLEQFQQGLTSTCYANEKTCKLPVRQKQELKRYINSRYPPRRRKVYDRIIL